MSEFTLFVTWIGTFVMFWVTNLHIDNVREEIIKHSQNKPKQLLKACIDTGALRCDTHRQLYEDVCRFLGVQPK